MELVHHCSHTAHIYIYMKTKPVMKNDTCYNDASEQDQVDGGWRHVVESAWHHMPGGSLYMSQSGSSTPPQQKLKLFLKM